ncbi:hypothetical protein [Serratia sp. Ag2]|nr:hypothetical protein [Serratia sp. Ag2]
MLDSVSQSPPIITSPFSCTQSAPTRQDHFRGCVVIPVIGRAESANVASRGQVLQLYGRLTQPDYKIIKGNPKHL